VALTGAVLGLPVEGHRERAPLIGAPDGGADRLEPRQQIRRRMAVVVAGADADGRQPWPQGGQQRAARGRGTAVVRHLEEVPAGRGGSHGSEQLGVSIVLEVTQQERVLCPEADGQHDRCVVDLAVGRRWGPVQPLLRGPDDVDARQTQAEGGTLAQPDPFDAVASRHRLQLPDAGTIGGDAALPDAPHPVAWREPREAPDMVLVRVRQHDEVHAAVPERDAFVEPPDEEVRVAPAVDQEARSVRGFHEDANTLADVEDRDAHASGRSRDEHHGEDPAPQAHGSDGDSPTTPEPLATRG
jgi:hypothetical protein